MLTPKSFLADRGYLRPRGLKRRELAGVDSGFLPHVERRDQSATPRASCPSKALGVFLLHRGASRRGQRT